jgi:hypothetical protein
VRMVRLAPGGEADDFADLLFLDDQGIQ